jgi:hypothetical protein
VDGSRHCSLHVKTRLVGKKSIRKNLLGTQTMTSVIWVCFALICLWHRIVVFIHGVLGGSVSVMGGCGQRSGGTRRCWWLWEPFGKWCHFFGSASMTKWSVHCCGYISACEIKSFTPQPVPLSCGSKLGSINSIYISTFSYNLCTIYVVYTSV